MAELRQASKKEFDYRTSARQLLRIDPSLQIVHEHFDIKLVVVHLTARPSHSPFSKTEDDCFQFIARSGWIILCSALTGYRFPHEQAGLFELIETFSQQSWRDLRSGALEIIEASRAEDKLANDKKGPTFPQQFGSLRHGTDLAVADAHQRNAGHYIQSS